MKPGRIQEKYLNIIVRETVSALAFIHKIGVIHRDVKGRFLYTPHSNSMI